ncbi:uncharacterized protein [Lolium perenne]|uniref:uncharacterized protein n=1 Tax=Lolium perenne TaxID=4522 RepID=UPI0021F548B7|nr:uncharacterized protein LOC127309566 [Lolium perenne]
MSESEKGGEMARHRRRRGSATVVAHTGVTPNIGDILWEIFLRLPPQPSSLPRVSLVCKRWRRLAADPEFLIRFRAHHRKAPLLGLFKEYGGWVSFTPVLGAPDRIPRRRFSMRIDYGGGAETHPFHGTLLGCRHGRVLVVDPKRREVLVCDPITGDQRHVALPPEFGTCGAAHGAVLCADGDEGHVHGGCHSSPFKVVLVQVSFGPGVPHPSPVSTRRRPACGATSSWRRKDAEVTSISLGLPPSLAVPFTGGFMARIRMPCN